MKIYIGYHKTHEFGKFKKDFLLTNKTQIKENSLIYIFSGDKKNKSDRVEYYLEGVFFIREVEEGSHELSSLDAGDEKFKYKLHLDKNDEFSGLYIPLKSYDWFDKSDFHNKYTCGQGVLEFSGVYLENFRDILIGLGVSSEQINNKANYSNLPDSKEQSVISDLSKIFLEDESPTERETLALSRIGQGKFKRNVREFWGGKDICPISAVAIPEILIASHIRPWAKCKNKAEKLDGANGLLLAASVDKLFDKYLISFEEKNDKLLLVINKNLDKSKLIGIGVEAGHQLDTRSVSHHDLERMKIYMAEHFKIFSEKNNKDL